MGVIASQIISLTIVYSAVYSGADQRKHQSSASPAFVRGIHRWPVNSPHMWPVTREMFIFDDVILCLLIDHWSSASPPNRSRFHHVLRSSSEKRGFARFQHHAAVCDRVINLVMKPLTKPPQWSVIGHRKIHVWSYFSGMWQNKSVLQLSHKTEIPHDDVISWKRFPH